jgi:hypothetical protein
MTVQQNLVFLSHFARQLHLVEPDHWKYLVPLTVQIKTSITYNIRNAALLCCNRRYLYVYLFVDSDVLIVIKDLSL